MKPFCEIIVADVLPALRAVITNELLKTYGLSQTQISKKLGITQPAISQYKKELRGQKTKLILSNKSVMKMVKELAHDIAIKDIDATDMHRRMCGVCKKVREEKLICKMHKHASQLEGTCELCVDLCKS
jgi:predicted transcriptional regulator